MDSKEKFIFCIGVLAGGFGLVIGFGTVLKMLDGTSEYPLSADLTGLVVLGLLPLVGGIWMCVRTKRKAALRLLDALENRILRLAGEHEGRLTVEEVAMNTHLTLDEAKKLLDRYVLNGYAELQVSESGMLVYNFPGMTREENKRWI